MILKQKINTVKDIAVYLETYGCQMNEYDSQMIHSILEKPAKLDFDPGAKNIEYISDKGFCFTNKIGEADWILLNTCAVRENAQDRIYSRLRHIDQYRKKGSRVGILGCMAQNLKERILENDSGISSFIKLIAGPDSYRDLPFLLKNIDEEISTDSLESVTIRSELNKNETYDGIYPNIEQGPGAYVTIMRGCNNFCSFCVVPFTRGRERSRNPKSILDEINFMIELGIKEVTLLGQNVNSYSFKGQLDLENVFNSSDSGGYGFSSLIEMLANESGLERIRFTSPHPKDFPMKLLEIIARNKNICPQIHLPLQSGSDRILGLMKRGYSAKEYLDLVKKIRSVIPDAALSTDIIFGFPGEMESEAKETLDLVNEIQFHQAFIFKYSQREHTYAFRHLKDDVPDKEKVQRVKLAVENQQRISLLLYQKMIGKEVEVLVERYSKRSNEDLLGRTIWGHKVIFPSSTEKIGDTVGLKIDGATPITLFGKKI